MEQLDHRGTDAPGHQRRPNAELREAVNFPHVPKIADPAFALIAARRTECRKCGWEDELKRFGRYMTDRAGLKLVDCECPDCGTKWKRIEV